MALKKNSPYKVFFDKAILNMIENGELYLYKQQNSELKIDCNVPPEEGYPFDFRKTASLFTILFFCAILSILSLCYEFFKRPKIIANSLCEEKMNLLTNLLNSQIFDMVEKFKNTDIQVLKTVYDVSSTTGNENCKRISGWPRKNSRKIPELNPISN